MGRFGSRPQSSLFSRHLLKSGLLQLHRGNLFLLLYPCNMSLTHRLSLVYQKIQVVAMFSSQTVEKQAKATFFLCWLSHRAMQSVMEGTKSLYLWALTLPNGILSIKNQIAKSNTEVHTWWFSHTASRRKCKHTHYRTILGFWKICQT